MIAITRLARLSAAVLALAGALLLAGCGDPDPVLVKASEAVFDKPHNMTFTPDGKHILVADQDHHVLRFIDPDTLKVVGEIGKGLLNQPRDMQFHPDGLLYVADSANHRVAVFRVDGLNAEFVKEFKRTLEMPEGIAIGPNKLIYVMSTRAGVITAFDTNGEVSNIAGGFGSAPLKFHNPHDALFGPDGNLYVADSENNRIQILDADLKLKKILSGAPWNFKGVRYFSYDNGLLYAADKFSDRLLVLDAEDDFEIVAILKVNQPEGVLARGKRFWVSEVGTGRVLMYEWQ